MVLLGLLKILGGSLSTDEAAYKRIGFILAGIAWIIGGIFYAKQEE